MMIYKRFFTSTSLNKFNCSNCKLYNRKTKICKINNLNAFENRLNEEICGLNAKNKLLLDETNLIKSEEFKKNSAFYTLLSIATIPSVLYIDFKCILLSIITLYSAKISNKISDDYKKKYFEDNDLDIDIDIDIDNK